jgi:tRNA-dihydrouridine synthase
MQDTTTGYLCDNPDLAKRLQDEAGCELLTVHCRHRTDKHNGPASLDDGTRLVHDLNIPVVINGAHIENMDDTERILKQSGAHGVMIARAFLEQPDLMSGGKSGISELNPALLAADYLEFATNFPPPNPLFIRKHLRWIFRSTLQPAEDFTDSDYKTDWRPRLWTFLVRPYLETMDQFRAIVLMYIRLTNIDAAACKPGEASRTLEVPLSLQGLPDPTFKSIRGARIRS